MLYTPCTKCGGMTACYCYTPGRQIADQYADVLTHLHAVLDGFGQYHLNDRICQDIFTKPLYRQWRDGRIHASS